LSVVIKAVERIAEAIGEAIGEDIEVRQRNQLGRALEEELPIPLGPSITILYVEAVCSLSIRPASIAASGMQESMANPTAKLRSPIEYQHQFGAAPGRKRCLLIARQADELPHRLATAS
jgi:hypothetical protein